MDYQFPPTVSEAVILNLVHEPGFYKSLSTEMANEILKAPGDFLVRMGKDPTTLIVTLKQNRIYEFLITTNETLVGVLFKIDRITFHSFDSLISGLRSPTHRIKIFGTRMELKRSIIQYHQYRRLGYLIKANVIPRPSSADNFAAQGKPRMSFLVPLRREVFTPRTRYNLDLLCRLRHKHIHELEDFQIYPNFYNTIVILKYNYYASTLYDFCQTYELPSYKVNTLIKQAAEGIKFLVDNNLYATVVCAQDCFIDQHDVIKIGAVWNENWYSSQKEIVAHDYYWRFCSPESVLLQKFNASSLLWNFGAFAWQIATCCDLLPYQYHSNTVSMIQTVEEDEFMFPGVHRLKIVEAVWSELTYGVTDFKSQIDTLPRVVKPIRDIVLHCTIPKVGQRISWERIMQVFAETPELFRE